MIENVQNQSARQISCRRKRDLNPRAAINDLLPFQGSPFDLLGISPKALREQDDMLANSLFSVNSYFKTFPIAANHNLLFSRKRRGWDSNPCALSDKRFSRPPRYDRFDTSPYQISSNRSVRFLCVFAERKGYIIKPDVLCQTEILSNFYLHFTLFIVNPSLWRVGVCECRSLLHPI